MHYSIYNLFSFFMDDTLILFFMVINNVWSSNSVLSIRVSNIVSHFLQGIFLMNESGYCLALELAASAVY